MADKPAWQNESGLRLGKRSILHKLDIGHGEIRTDPGEPEPAPAGWTAQHGAPGGIGSAKFRISIEAFKGLLDFPEDVEITEIYRDEVDTFCVTIKGPNLHGQVNPQFSTDETRRGFRFTGFEQVS